MDIVLEITYILLQFSYFFPFSFVGWRSMRLQPLSVFLVKNGQGGDRILFRYPYKVSSPKKATAFYGITTGGAAGGCGVESIITGNKLLIFILR